MVAAAAVDRPFVLAVSRLRVAAVVDNTAVVVAAAELLAAPAVGLHYPVAVVVDMPVVVLVSPVLLLRPLHHPYPWVDIPPAAAVAVAAEVVVELRLPHPGAAVPVHMPAFPPLHPASSWPSTLQPRYR